VVLKVFVCSRMDPGVRQPQLSPFDRVPKGLVCSQLEKLSGFFAYVAPGLHRGSRVPDRCAIVPTLLRDTTQGPHDSSIPVATSTLYIGSLHCSL
jgi:hypothetical protein